jgi:hypothetical protein
MWLGVAGAGALNRGLEFISNVALDSPQGPRVRPVAGDQGALLLAELRQLDTPLAQGVDLSGKRSGINDMARSSVVISAHSASETYMSSRDLNPLSRSFALRHWSQRAR